MIFKKTLGQCPGVFLETKSDVFDRKSAHVQLYFKQSLDVFLTLAFSFL